MQDKNITDTQKGVVVLMVNGQPCPTPLTALNNDLLYELKQIIMNELGKCDTCCDRRAKLYDFIGDINYILSQRATVALCLN